MATRRFGWWSVAVVILGIGIAGLVVVSTGVGPKAEPALGPAVQVSPAPVPPSATEEPAPPSPTPAPVPPSATEEPAPPSPTPAPAAPGPAPGPARPSPTPGPADESDEHSCCEGARPVPPAAPQPAGEDDEDEPEEVDD